jgi:hypothetical protein
MLADFFAKALQGMKFRIMRDRIMNIAHNSKYHSGHRSVLNNDENDTDERYSTEVAQEN